MFLPSVIPVPFCHSRENGNPSFVFLCFLFYYFPVNFIISVIPVTFLSFPLSLCHSRAGGNPSLVFLLIFSSSLCHCELSKKVWQSHYSFVSFIFFCHCEHRFWCEAISFPFIFQYFTFFRCKNYKKTIFLINIYYIYYLVIIH